MSLEPTITKIMHSLELSYILYYPPYGCVPGCHGSRLPPHWSWKLQ